MKNLRLYEDESEQLKRLIRDLENIGFDIIWKVKYFGSLDINPLTEKEKEFFSRWIGPNKERIEEITGWYPIGEETVNGQILYPRFEGDDIDLKIDITLRGEPDNLYQIDYVNRNQPHSTEKSVFKITQWDIDWSKNKKESFTIDDIVILKEIGSNIIKKKPIAPIILDLLYKALPTLKHM